MKVLLKKYQIPVFASLGTLSEITHCKGFDNKYREFMYKVIADRPFNFNGFKVNCFNIPHDAAEPLGFSFEKYDTKIAVCTDFGRVTDEIENGLKGSNAIVIEANHDERMLEAGKYPFRLKRRILGDKGHSSNETSGKLITRLWNKNLKHIFLSHLSDENNMPELALETVKCELSMAYSNYEKYTKITVANRDTASDIAILNSALYTDRETA